MLLLLGLLPILSQLWDLCIERVSLHNPQNSCRPEEHSEHSTPSVHSAFAERNSCNSSDQIIGLVSEMIPLDCLRLRMKSFSAQLCGIFSNPSFNLTKG